MGRAIGPGTRYDVGNSDNEPPSPLPPRHLPNVPKVPLGRR